jgi:NNP family nitrate/nitrite transporter-like MFS transporter
LFFSGIKIGFHLEFSAPILLFVAALTFIFGQDHPAGKWSERHTLPAAALAVKEGHQIPLDHPEKKSTLSSESKDEKDVEGNAAVSVRPVIVEEDLELVKSTVDVAINERLTLKTAVKILTNPLTWLPALAYLTTFGVELAIDSKFSDVLFVLFSKKRHGFNQTTAGYYTSILYVPLQIADLLLGCTDHFATKTNRGLLNLVTRPAGGYIGDVVYRHYGTKGKKAWTLLCGLIMGAALLAGGFYLQNTRTSGDESCTSH